MYDLLGADIFIFVAAELYVRFARSAWQFEQIVHQQVVRFDEANERARLEGYQVLGSIIKF